MPNVTEHQAAADTLRRPHDLVHAGRRLASAARGVDAIRSPTVGALCDTALVRLHVGIGADW